MPGVSQIYPSSPWKNYKRLLSVPCEGLAKTGPSLGLHSFKPPRGCGSQTAGVDVG